jgi:putative DNA primase/helicase
MVANGRPCAVITGSRSSEEMQKVLGAILLEGSSMTSLDNLTHDIEGNLLAQMVTQIYIKPRILGESKVPECEWRGTLYATGNNIRVVGDMARRAVVCNIDAKLERPEQRHFKANPIKQIEKDRSRYIAAIITIARAYAQSGEKAEVSPLVGFEGWTRFVREPLVWLGEADPVDSMEQTRARDPSRVAANELINHWYRLIGIDKVVTVRKVIEIANEVKEATSHGDRVYRHAAFRELLLGEVGTAKGEIEPVPLGKWLQTLHGRIFDGMRIEVEPKKGAANRYVLHETSAQK